MAANNRAALVVAGIMGDCVVCRSELIENLREARRYYEERLQGAVKLSCRGCEILVFFPKGENHVYTKKPHPEAQPHEIVRVRRKGGAFDERVFCLERARLLDAIVPALRAYSYAIRAESPPNSPRFFIHGQQLLDGRYLRVLLRSDSRMWYCLTAFPIEAEKWRRDRGGAISKFPP